MWAAVFSALLTGCVTFLSPNKKVTKEVGQRGARCKRAPFGNPRRLIVLHDIILLLKTMRF